MCDLSSQFSSAQAPDVGRAMPKIILVEKKCAHGTSAANVLHPCTISRTFSSRKSIPLNPRRWPPAPLDPPDPPRPRACRPGGPGGQNLCQGQRFASPPSPRAPGPAGPGSRESGGAGGAPARGSDRDMLFSLGDILSSRPPHSCFSPSPRKNPMLSIL